MQPYFLPYLGYFQLISAVDKFIIYDNIKYTKKGWINRNRWLVRGSDVLFTLPLRNGSDALQVNEREISNDFNRIKFLNQLTENYRRAPHFDETYSLMEKLLPFEDRNLFRVIYNSALLICRHLHLTTELIISSSIDTVHDLKGRDRVIALCKAVDSKIYINPTGGTALYSPHDFHVNGLILKFIRSRDLLYKQFENHHIPNLSIVDVLMFNPVWRVKELLNEYDLICGNDLIAVDVDGMF